MFSKKKKKNITVATCRWDLLSLVSAGSIYLDIRYENDLFYSTSTLQCRSIIPSGPILSVSQNRSRKICIRETKIKKKIYKKKNNSEVWRSWVALTSREKGQRGTKKKIGEKKGSIQWWSDLFLFHQYVAGRARLLVAEVDSKSGSRGQANTEPLKLSARPCDSPAIQEYYNVSYQWCHIGGYRSYDYSRFQRSIRLSARVH